MKYSLTLLALGATSISAFAFPAPIAQSSSNCDAVSLGECAQPLTQKVLDCGTTDLKCLCTTVSDLIGCYDQFCPGQAPAEINEAIDACNSAGQDVADPTGGTGASLDASSTAFASGSEKPTSTGRGLDDLASEASSAAEETETSVDQESTEKSTARVTKTTSQNDSKQTSSAEPEQNDSISGEATESGETATSIRRQSGTSTRPAPTQSSGAADALVAPVGGLLAAAVGFAALL